MTYIVSCIVIMVVLLIIDFNNITEEKEEALRQLKERFNVDIHALWFILVLFSSILVPLSLLSKFIKLILFLSNIHKENIDKESKK